MIDGGLDQSYRRAIKFVASQQNKSGSFDCFSSSSVDDFTGADRHQAILPMAVILRALNGMELPDAIRVRRSLAGFLAGQVGEHGSFNYWVRGSDRASQQPYPDDLDDTSYGWLALTLEDPNTLSAQVLAKLAQLLMAVEVEPGGPYRTWLVGRAADAEWRDVDVAVNANIWSLMRRLGVNLPGLEGWLTVAVKEGELRSRYYPGEAVILYFLAEWSRGELRSLLQDRWRAELARKDHSLLELALLTVAGVWLGVGRSTIQPLVEELINSQVMDGSWPAAGLCYDPAKAGRCYYAGSASMTTALAAQALCLVQAMDGSVVPKPVAIVKSAKAAPMWPAVRRHIQRLPQSAQILAEPILNKVHKLDASHGVTALVPHIMLQIKPKNKKLPKGHRTARNHLILGSLYGWLAYTASDDVRDGEADYRLQPLIQLWTGQMRSHFWQASGNSEYQRWTDRQLQIMDMAHHWEQQNTRFEGSRVRVDELPEYGSSRRLAEGSSGHLIAPVGALVALGYEYNGSVNRKLKLALRHLIAARQLHDDAHDWSQDLAEGQINFVAAQVLRAEFKSQRGKTLNLADPQTMAGLRHRFWSNTVDDILPLIQRHLYVAERQLADEPLLGGLEDLSRMIQQLKQTTRDTLVQRNQARRFLSELTFDRVADRSAV